VEEHEGDVNQAVLVLNKESVAPIETARGVLNFGFSAIHIKVYKPAAGNPAEQVLPEELEAPGGPEDGYSTDSSEELVRWFQSRLAGATERVAGCG